MNIPNEMLENQVEHRYGGNNWCVVANREEEWMDLINASEITPGTHIFHCWSRCVTVEKKLENIGTPENPKWVKSDKNVPIKPEILDKVNAIRKDLASGKKIIKNTRLVKA